MTAPPEYAVIITRGRIGFPVGEWSRFLYRPMAVCVANGAGFRRLGIVAEVREVEPMPSKHRAECQRRDGARP
jgi:hypothetical protein